MSFTHSRVDTLAWPAPCACVCVRVCRAPTGRDALKEHLASRIPGAQLFELDAVADLTHSVPHMLPSDAAFSAAMDALGVTADSTVVVYDRFPSLYSAPRVWWTFKVFGHERWAGSTARARDVIVVGVRVSALVGLVDGRPCDLEHRRMHGCSATDASRDPTTRVRR